MMAEDSCGKTLRVLSIFVRLVHGAGINKNREVERFSVNEKTIQRSLDEIRSYLADAARDGACGELVYRRADNSYYLEKSEEGQLQGTDILVLAKILLESRSLCKKEMDSLLDKLMQQALPQHKKMIEKLVGNEKFHYAPVSHEKNLTALIWELSCALREKRRVKIQYKKENDQTSILRELEPQGVIFSEYYFYLLACIVGKEYDFPAVYRIDRIEAIEVLSEKFTCAYCNRFEEGEFRKRVQFMKSGKILKIIFRYTGTSSTAVLDRLPTAKVIKTDSTGQLIETEVYGDGIKMWFLGQAEHVEVLKPEWFRLEIKTTIAKMGAKYETDKNKKI